MLMKLWLMFIIVFLAGIVVFFPTFKLSLYGDDWLVFWRFDSFFPSPQSVNVFDYFNHFLTRYGSQDIMMGFLRSIFGYKSEYYYITSFVMRILAAFSLYPLAFYLTKNKTAVFFAMLFFSVTTIGLETTEYISHITSYIGLSFFNIFLYYFIKSRETDQKELFRSKTAEYPAESSSVNHSSPQQADGVFWFKNKKILFSGLFFFLTFVTVPIRMTGLLPFILLIEIFWAAQQRSKAILRTVFLRLSFILLIFIFINLIGKPFYFPAQGGDTTPPSNTFLINQTADSLSNMQNLLENQRSDFLFYPVISFGSMFLPDTIIRAFPLPFSGFKKVLLMIVVYTLFASMALTVKNSVFANKSVSSKFILLPAAAWSIISFAIYSTNQATIPDPKYFILLLVGGYMTILSLFLLSKYFNNYLVSQALFLSFCWSIVSFFIPWFWSPTFLLETYHRYLIGSAVGISLLLATIMSLAKSVMHQRIILTLCVILLVVNIWTTGNHIKKLLDNHNQQFNNKIWAAMPYIKDVGTSTEPLLFYFEGDGTNESILHDTVTFGFPFHMGLLYKTTQENRNPISVIEWRDVESAVLDGKSFAPHRQGKILDPISPERIYAFRLQGKDNLINITNDARKKLIELLQNK